MKKLLIIIGIAVTAVYAATAIRDVCEFLSWEIHTIQ